MAKLRFELKKAIAEFEGRTGLRITYDELSEMSGLSRNLKMLWMAGQEATAS